MDIVICPFCESEISIQNKKSNFKEIINKYLNIIIKEEYASNVCLKCEEIVLVWDEFAMKCLTFQELLNSTSKDVKLEEEYPVIKVENLPHVNDSYEFEDNDDKHSISQCGDSKDDDPLSDCKIEDETFSADEKVRSQIRKTKKSPKFMRYICRTCKAEMRNWTSLESHCLEEHSTKPEILCGCGEYLNSLNDIFYHRNHEKNKDKHPDNSSESMHEKIQSDDEFEKPLIGKEQTKDNKNSQSALIDFICYICDIKYDNWNSLKRHSLTEHSAKPKVLCICGKYLSANSSVYRHRAIHDENKGLKCEHCGKKFTEKAGFKEHMMAHIPKEEYSFSCSQCPKKFPTALTLKLHNKTHTGQFTCDICGMTLTSKYSLKTHKLTIHMKIKDFICDICGHAFAAKGTLEDHKVTHIVERKFKCETCFKCFKSLPVLRCHENTHNQATVQCPQCPAVFKSRRNLREHKIIHLDVYKFSCKICNKKFKKSCYLKTHMNSHDGLKLYSCRWCSKIFSTNQNLRHHIQRTHSDKIGIGSNMWKNEIDTDMSEHTE